MENLSLFTIFNIFNDEDTIYCCYQEHMLDLSQITIMLFFPDCGRQEHELLSLSLQLIEKRGMVDFMTCNCLEWKWITLDGSVNSRGFYLKTKNSSILIRQKYCKVSIEDQDFRNDSDYTSSSIVSEKKENSNIFCELPCTIKNGREDSARSKSPTTSTPISNDEGTGSEPPPLIVVDDSDDASCKIRSSPDRTASLKHSVTVRNGDEVLLSGENVLDVIAVSGRGLRNKRKLCENYVERYIEGRIVSFHSFLIGCTSEDVS